MPDTDLNAEKGAWKSGEVGAKIGEIGRKIWDAFSDFEKKKDEFPRHLVGRLMEEFPNMNVAVFHDQRSKYYFVNGSHYHFELSGPLWLSFGYEAWVFESGYLHRYGDAGWENWTFGGNYYYQEDRHEEVVFGTRWPKHKEPESIISHETHKIPTGTVNIRMETPEPEIYYETNPLILYNLFSGKSDEFMRAHLNHNAQRWRPDGWWDSHPFGTREGGRSGTIKYYDSEERVLGNEEREEVQREKEIAEKIKEMMEKWGKIPIPSVRGIMA
ncbi:hypothetical protein TWF730_004346 [Orbilia blumenaviensis]|uniref:Uncharacterized protein n=1 Tax=Orbilia blumenaviensis TaxID=1796055 RepID=A0AAV9U411_9PEZI